MAAAKRLCINYVALSTVSQVDYDDDTDPVSKYPLLRAAAPFGCLWVFLQLKLVGK